MDVEGQRFESVHIDATDLKRNEESKKEIGVSPFENPDDGSQVMTEGEVSGVLWGEK